VPTASGSTVQSKPLTGLRHATVSEKKVCFGFPVDVHRFARASSIKYHQKEHLSMETQAEIDSQALAYYLLTICGWNQSITLSRQGYVAMTLMLIFRYLPFLYTVTITPDSQKTCQVIPMTVCPLRAFPRTQKSSHSGLEKEQERTNKRGKYTAKNLERKLISEIRGSGLRP
jgi:hypothetical protein